MKRIFMTAVVLVIAAAVLPAQDVGSTWIDSTNGANMLFPTSMISEVSDGAYTDEIDILLRSPLELANYDGYGIFTLYGNHSAHWGITGYNNPFNTGGVNVQLYQFGATMPLGEGMRGGFVGRYWNTTTPGLAGGLSFIEDGEVEQTRDTTDPEEVIHESTETTAYNFTVSTNTRNHIFGTGLNMGPFAASLFVGMNNDARTVGGTYTYEYARRDNDFDPGNQLTLESYILGRDDEGKARSYPSDSDWSVTLLGQLPLALIGESSPLTAFLRVGAESDYDNLLTGVRTVFAQTTMTDWEENETVRITRTYGENLSGNPNLEANLPGSGAVAAGDDAGGATYFDLDNIRNGKFGFELGGGIDPVIALDERVTAFTKAHMLFGMNFGSNNTAEREELRVRNSAAETDWQSSYSEISEESNLEIDLQSELGGRLAFTDESGFLTLSTGLFLRPGYNRDSTTPKTTTTVTERRNDGTGNDLTEAAVEAAGGPVAAAALVDENIDGRSVLTQTTEWEGADASTTLSLDLVIPTSVRMDFREGTLSLIGGYNISHTQSWTTNKDDRTSTTTNSAAMTTADGNVTVTDGPIASETTSAPRIEKTSAAAPWAGQMDWMVRWTPNESLTVDMSGASVMTALNMDLFGRGGNAAGFNPATILNSLNFGISFRF
ncbi:hypothetical protein [Spirochaeta dissipatitropha]